MTYSGPKIFYTTPGVIAEPFYTVLLPFPIIAYLHRDGRGRNDNEEYVDLDYWQRKKNQETAAAFHTIIPGTIIKEPWTTDWDPPLRIEWWSYIVLPHEASQ